jgi:spermidine synthase
MELWYYEKHTDNVSFGIRMNKQLISCESDFQRIDIYDSYEFGRILILDGFLMVTEKDEFIYHEMITHVPMAVNPSIENVLVIGAGDGGVVRELCRYKTIKNIDMVEIDKLVVDACREYLPSISCSLSDSRVNIFYEDGLKYVRRKKDQYDLIIVDSTDPFGRAKDYLQKSFTATAITP